MKEYFLKTESDFWNGYAHQWNLNNRDPVVGWYDFHNAWADYDNILFDGVDTNGKLALEYGCGPGRNLIKFSEPKWGFRCVDGVDIAPKNLENAVLNMRDAESKLGRKLYAEREPKLILNDGAHLPTIGDGTYDIAFSVICLQHIQSYDVRKSIFTELFRVLKPGSFFCAQMGFGPGHRRSVDYYYNGETHFDGDIRVEKPEYLEKDLTEIGFSGFKYVLRPPCKDEHPLWIWFQCKKD